MWPQKIEIEIEAPQKYKFDISSSCPVPPSPPAPKFDRNLAPEVTRKPGVKFLREFWRGRPSAARLAHYTPDRGRRDMYKTIN